MPRLSFLSYKCSPEWSAWHLTTNNRTTLCGIVVSEKQPTGINYRGLQSPPSNCCTKCSKLAMHEVSERERIAS